MSGLLNDKARIPRTEAADLDDRRGAPRFALLIQAAKLICSGREYLCIVRDASSEGLKIKHFGHLPESDGFTIELSNGECFAVDLVWQDDHAAGLRFANEVDFARIVGLARNDAPRRPLRLDISAPASLSRNGDSCDATLCNLSQQGAGVICDAHLAIDQFVRLDVEGLPEIFAKVRWRRGSEYGLIFETTLKFEELASSVARLHAANSP